MELPFSVSQDLYAVRENSNRQYNLRCKCIDTDRKSFGRVQGQQIPLGECRKNIVRERRIPLSGKRRDRIDMKIKCRSLTKSGVCFPW